MCMRTNIEIDRELVEDAMRITGVATMREVVDLALRELVDRPGRRGLLRWIGKLDWQGDLEEMRGSRDVEHWELPADWRDRLRPHSDGEGGGGT
jgi:Arc/MetJ family transcription regulator